MRKKLSETQEQLELGLDKCQKAEEDATEKAEQVTFNIINKLFNYMVRVLIDRQFYAPNKKIKIILLIL